MSYSFFIRLSIGREKVVDADKWGLDVSMGIKMRKRFWPPCIEQLRGFVYMMKAGKMASVRR
jgi:hypothetical protein